MRILLPARRTIRITPRTIVFHVLGLCSICTCLVAIPSFQNTITPAGIVIHHLAVPPEFVPALSISEIDDLHRYRGFRIFYWGRIYHIGYHFVILPDGTILRGRPERLRGAHTLGYNDYLGICLVGDFSTHDNPDGRIGLRSPSEEEMRSLVKLTHDMQLKYRIGTERIFLHRELSSRTECPGDRFDRDSFFKRLASFGTYDSSR